VVTRTAVPDKEQRRARRYAAQLRVELRERDKSHAVVATDVSRHGIFVSTQDSPAALPRERHLVQLLLHLPDGSTSVSARVARVLPGIGFGAEFFALSAEAKNAWDNFVSGLSLSGVPQKRKVIDGTDEGAQAPVFVVRLKSLESLRNYEEKHLRAGGTILVTPVLPALGSPVRLAVVHPLTQQEMPLDGVVRQVFTDKPKRVEIEFPHNPAVEVAFAAFIASGRPPSEKTTSAPLHATAPPTELELDVDFQDDEIAPSEEPVRELPVVVGSLAGHRRRRDPFFDVSGFPATAKAPEASAAPASSGHTSSASVTSGGPSVVVLRCGFGCDEQVLELGPSRGALGLVANEVPMVVPSTRNLVQTTRLVPAAERQKRLKQQLLAGAITSTAVDVGMLIAVAELVEPARHLASGEVLEAFAGADQLVSLATTVPLDVEYKTEVRCSSCEHGTLHLYRPRR
jgi:hypothetical protein